MINGFGWSQKEKAYDYTYEQLDQFFEKLYEESLTGVQSIGMTYRESQQTFASTVMESIKNSKALLIEAGVGTGKSFGYLIPIFFTWNNVRSFQKIIISTSSLALQEQLARDIEFISERLGITIKYSVVKGINNYACIRRLEDKLVTASNHHDADTYEKLLKIKREIYKSESADKSKLGKVSKDLWQSINVCGGCDRCNYHARCMFMEAKARETSASIVITNHLHLNNMLKGIDGTISGSDMLVIDEAHNLEEQIRLVNQGEINFDEFMRKLDSLYFLMNDDPRYDYSYELKILDPLIVKIRSELISLAVVMRSNARYIYNRQSNSDKAPIQECDKLSINPENVKIKERVNILWEHFKTLNDLLSKLPERNNIASIKEQLKGIIKVFKDLSLGNDGTLLYWVKFIDNNKIKLVYTIKDIKPYLDKILGREKPTVLTSATLTTNGTYDHFASSLGLTEGEYEIENPIPSPFDFENNSMFYYDETLPSPTDSDRKKYIYELAVKIANMIALTKGKALVLFTSKRDMKEAYDIVKNLLEGYDIYLQEDADVVRSKEQFLSSEDASLFATGAYWEGMDFPGKTLSNLIIAKLPFPVQDPVVDYKKTLVPKEESFQVDLNEMLMKLAQGTGRLIRKSTDTGIVCCLDSRTPKYLDAIKRSLQFKTYTNSLDELVEFAKRKILEEDTSVTPIQQ